jgi:hypothetical protein
MNLWFFLSFSKNFPFSCSDEAIIALSNTCTELRKLNLQCCDQITEAGFMALSNLHHLVSLNAYVSIFLLFLPLMFVFYRNAR